MQCWKTLYASWNVNNLIKYAVNVLKDEMRFRSEYAALESSFNLNNCVTVNTKNIVKILELILELNTRIIKPLFVQLRTQGRIH